MIAYCKKKLRVSFLLIYLLLTAASGIAQVYSVKATVDKDKILLGEQLLFTIEVNAEPGDPYALPLIDTIPHFEILEKFDPQHTGNTMIQSYRLTSFDSGHWVIPAFSIAKQYTTDTIPVDVVFSDFDPTKDYHDIKEIIEIPPEKPINWLWWIIIASVLVLLIVVWLVTRKKKPEKKTVAVDAFKEAMTRLDELQRSNLTDKQLYAEIVDVFRLYVFRKKGILSLQKTTDDLVLQLSEMGLNKEVFAELSQALRLADFVKFAKFQPTSNDKEKTIEAIKQAILFIEKTISPSMGGG